MDNPLSFFTSGDDDDVDWEVSPEYLEYLQEKYKPEDMPLFSRESPTSIEGKPAFEALQRLMYDEDSPDTVAENFKSHGNSLFSRGRKYWQDAIISYSKGLDMNVNDKKLLSQLYSNRAQVHLTMGGYVKCVDDCRSAIKADHSNGKAFYRAAKASLAMHLYKQACEFARRGSLVEPSSEAFKHILKHCEGQLTEFTEAKSIEEKKYKSRKQEFDDFLSARGIQVVDTPNPYGFEVSACDAASAIRSEDEKIVAVNWPVFILLDDVMVSEKIRQFSEFDCFASHLKIMFPGGSEFPEWDTEHKYSWKKLLVYYEPEDVRPGNPRRTLFEVPLHIELRFVLNLVRVVSVHNPLIFHVISNDDDTTLNQLREQYEVKPLPEAI